MFESRFEGPIKHISKIIQEEIDSHAQLVEIRQDLHFRVNCTMKADGYEIVFWHEPSGFIRHDIYSYDDIATIGDICLHTIVNDMASELKKFNVQRNDPLDAARYFYETTQYFKKSKEKENNKMEKRITSTVKTEAEVNYDNTISEIDQHQAEDYDRIRKEADAARLAAKQELEIQTLREEKRRIALDYRFFYEELIAAGFSEEEAWKILLNKQPGYMAPPYYSFSDI